MYQYFTIYRQYFFLKIEHFSWISNTVCIFIETTTDKYDILNIPDGFSYVAKNRKIFKHKSGGIVVVYKNNLKNHIKFKYLIMTFYFRGEDFWKSLRRTTDGRQTTDDDDGRQVMRIAHMTLWVRWAKNDFIDEYREFSGRVYTHPNKRSLLNT
jgi:hypothetical protein